MIRNCSFLLVAAIILPTTAVATAPPPGSVLDSLAITVRGVSREFAYTNKESAFLYGETNASNTTSWQGFNVFGHEFLDDYRLIVDGKELDRSAARTTVYPDFMRRTYPSGVVEEVHPADSLSVFIVTIASPLPVEVRLLPLFSDGGDPADYEISLSPSCALVARKGHLARTVVQNYPVWLAVYAQGFTPVLHSETRGLQHSPVELRASRSKTHTLVFAVGDNRNETDALARAAFNDRSRQFVRRRTRIEQLLNASPVRTSDERFDKALGWAKVSLDALIMNQVTKGIFAGLPWFNNYWGRDTFISLPGAALVTGQFAEARRILSSFAASQERDSMSTDYGRVPNLITTTNKAYNTADGTPRFVMMVREYVERAADSVFALEMYPIILRSIEGTIRYHRDSFGFLTHGDAETWMDAVGPEGPWSPRGTRGNDIQALWAGQLEAGIFFATRFGDVESAHSWDDALTRLRTSFSEMFVTRSGIADRLKDDDRPDMQMRPNQIFTGNLLSDADRSAMVATVTTRLTYAHGVASLSQLDENFHPYHQYVPYYPKDAAYHNGTVWTWLQGPLISELCRLGGQNLAYRITNNSVHQILDRGAVGTQSELLDARPFPGEPEPRLSGSFSQAWSLAEFIRNFYDDYLGVRYDGLARKLTIAPHIPAVMGTVQARINSDPYGFGVILMPGSEFPRVTIDAGDRPDTVSVRLVLRGTLHTTSETTFSLPPSSQAIVEHDGNVARVLCNGQPWPSTRSIIPPQPNRNLPPGLSLAQPALRSGLKSMRPPAFPVISHDVVMMKNPAATVLLEASDPTSDDTGSSGYTYPRHPAFIRGSFDLQGMKVAVDDSLVYFSLTFRKLSNPGWHPEYGFQLTFVAVAIDTDGVDNSGTLRVGRNASFTLDAGHGYEKIIYVGGGIRVEDGSGRILAAHIPQQPDASNPFGDAPTGTIRFALPMAVVGRPSPAWTFTVLAGAQDDHGGAGLGEFRTVNKEEGEWNGGGKTATDDPNVYDTLVARPSR